jgi:hypothetical protein
MAGSEMPGAGSRMTRCGRCNEEITAGYFCPECRSALGALHLPSPSSYKAASISPPGARMKRDHARRLTSRRDARVWRELILMDRGLSIGIRANDAVLLRLCLTSPIPHSGDVFHDAVLHFAIKAHHGKDGRQYTVIAEGHSLPAVRTRTEALAQLVSQVHCWTASQSHGA